MDGFGFGNFMCGWWGFVDDWDFTVLVVFSYWECGEKGVWALGLVSVKGDLENLVLGFMTETVRWLGLDREGFSGGRIGGQWFWLCQIWVVRLWNGDGDVRRGMMDCRWSKQGMMDC